MDDFYEIAKRASEFTQESAAMFARSQFPGIKDGVLRGSLSDFRTARNDLVRCRHCARPLLCPLSGRPMRLTASRENGENVIRAQRAVCRRWSSARQKRPDAVEQKRRDLD